MKTKRVPATPLRPYPNPDDYRGGCKVSFYLYKNEDTARKASEAAQYNGRIRAEAGYDFGYRAPGECYQLKDGPRAGWWEVVIP